MNHHFATSWLQSLSTKLEALVEWSWAAGRNEPCTTHRQLFREFFSPTFQKTLALVELRKKTEFLQCIERNLYKFEDRTQQFPLGCLCALLQHGKESPQTQEKVVAWVEFLLDRLRTGIGKEAVTEVGEECLSAPFQKFVGLMDESLQERLADRLGEHLVKLDEESQKRILENLAPVPARMEKVVVSCTQELNSWLESAPRFPSTPIALADTLTKMEHPLVRFFTGIKDRTKKEAFLVAVALALQGLRTRFRWMCAVEPDLGMLGADLQRRLFTVPGQGPVMEMWLSSRLKKYNAEVAGRTAELVTDPAKYEQLRATLMPLFSVRNEGEVETRFVPLDGPTPLADALLKWLGQHIQGFFCPQHTLARETLTSVLQRFGRYFEIDPHFTRARLVHQVSPVPEMSKPSFPPAAATQLVPLSSSPVIVPPRLTSLAALTMQSRPQATSGVLALPAPPMFSTPSGPPVPATSAAAPGAEVDNLIDFLLNEALESVPADTRSRIQKIGHGVYRFAGREITLHTQNGRLFVYRIGEAIRHMPIQSFLSEEGLAQPAGTSTALVTVSSGAAVDTSSVARIALQSAQISAGVTAITAAPQAQPQLPFGLSRAADQKSDPQTLMSKRVEAATKAMDISKQIVRRSINFEDEKFLKKLLTKGLKHDKTWQTAYTEYCSASGVAMDDQQKQDKDFVATFIERNLANSINQDWAKKIMYGPYDEKKEKKEKSRKDKKDKKDKKKDKKRKASESSSSERYNASTALTVPTPPAPPPPMEMPMGLPMYGGMPMGLGGMMAPPGMNHMGMVMGEGMHMSGMQGMPGMHMQVPGHMMGAMGSMDVDVDDRGRKRGREKIDKPKKSKHKRS